MSKRFGLFLLVGGTAAAVNIAARALFNIWVPYGVAIVLAYIPATALAYWLNRAFVFEKSKYSSAAPEVAFFLLVNLSGLIQTWIVSMLLAQIVFPWWAGQAPDMAIPRPRLLAHICGLASLSLTSYFGHKHLSFRQHSPQNSN